MGNESDNLIENFYLKNGYKNDKDFFYFLENMNDLYLFTEKEKITNIIYKENVLIFKSSKSLKNYSFRMIFLYDIYKCFNKLYNNNCLKDDNDSIFLILTDRNGVRIINSLKTPLIMNLKSFISFAENIAKSNNYDDIHFEIR